MASLDLSDDGREVEMKVGETLVVSLPENATTGYRWSADRHDEEVVEISPGGSDYPGGAVGSGGDAAFTLAAKKPGSAEIGFRYWRDWEGETSIVNRFRIRVMVRP